MEYLKNIELREISDQLEEGIVSVLNSEEYKRYLSFMAAFHRYSANNIALILKQFPDATMVAGYSTWKTRFKRHIRKGEKGIRVIMPSPLKIRKTDEKTGKTDYVTIPRYRVGYVYDVSQTEGRDLPEFEINNLSGNVKEYDVLLKAMKEAIGIPVTFQFIPGGANGYYSNRDKRIVISDSLSQMHSIKTLIHEISHNILHDRDYLESIGVRKESWEKEIEAESIAYCVCSHYGIDTSDYSFRYIAAWAREKDLSDIKSCFETIRKTSYGLIYSIDRKYTELVRGDEIRKIAEGLEEYIKDLEPERKERISFIRERLLNNETEYLLDMVRRESGNEKKGSTKRKKLEVIKNMIENFREEKGEREYERNI